jgi:hypothetical protein
MGEEFKEMNVKYLDLTPFLIPQKAREFTEAGNKIYSKA